MKYVDTILEHLIDLKEDGSFRLDQRYFDYCAGLRMTNNRFHDLFGGPPHMDLFDLKPEAVAWLADKGYDERMGARPLGRVIQEHIKKPLADEVLFGKLASGGTVRQRTGIRRSR